jgi:type IV pilus assembly protein PilV
MRLRRCPMGAVRAGATVRGAAGRRGQRGVGLMDAAVALVILAFGLLALTRFQSRLVVQATESQQRSAATLLADELLNTMLVDTPNAACYTLPAAGACGSAAASARAADWQARAIAALPGEATATSTILNNQMTVRLTWYFKDASEVHVHEVISDIRTN